MTVVYLVMALIVAVSACNGAAGVCSTVGQANVSGSINTILKTATVSE